MSRGLNKVMLIGNLGKDPELSYTPNGTAIARFSIATSESRKNQAGEWEERTDWHNIKLFGKTAETANQYLNKGSQVYIEGRIETRQYEQEGVKKWYTEIIGLRMLLLGRKGEGGGDREYQQPSAQPSPPAPEPDAPEEVDEDLPF